jgi:hypothetical protein
MITAQRPNEQRATMLFLAAAFFFSWYFLYVDGLWGYSQHLILKKKYIPTSVFVLIIGGLILLNRRKNADETDELIHPVLFSWICWMLIVLLMASNVNLSHPFRIAFGFYVNYWHLFLAAIAINSSFRIKEQHFIVLLFTAAMPVIALGIAQGVMKDNFAIGNWIAQEAAAFNLGFFGSRRANGAFAHAEDLGFFSAIVMSVAFALFLSKKETIWRMGMAVVILGCLLATFFTFTRATYLVAATALAATFYIHYTHTRGHKPPYWIPAAYFVLGTLIYFSAPLISMFSSSDTILSSASLGERLYGNRYYLGEMQRQGWHSTLTGLGWFVNGHYKATFAIDNQYIALMLSTGLIGLCFWVVVTVLLWKNLLKRALASGSPALIGLAGVASTWAMQSIFNVTSMLAFVSIAGLAIAYPARHAEKT